ncbi:TPA: Serine/threonine-protein kinase Nek3 [Trebouxia sp. C0004]
MSADSTYTRVDAQDLPTVRTTGYLRVLLLSCFATVLTVCRAEDSALQLPKEVSRVLSEPTGPSDVSLKLTADRAQETQARSTDTSPWLADYKRADTLIPSSLLPKKQTTLFYTRAYRITGHGILPLKQGLIDIQAEVLATHCPLFEYEGRGFLVTGSAPTQYSYNDLLQMKDKDAEKLCETVCMVQYYPLNMKQNLTDCPACIIHQPEVGYEQYDNVHAMFEVHINRSSLIPEVMRLRWFPTTSDPIFADAGIQRELPQLEAHFIHNAQLAQYVTEWHPYRAATLTIQIEGPNVAPLTVDKQNLVVYVLRQLEKHFFEVNQFFRIHNCSHDESLQQAHISLAIVTHSDITVGLDVVVVSYSQQLQEGLIKEGLNVTRLTVSGPDPYPNETVADQIVEQLGEPSIWTRYRSQAPKAAMTGLAVLLTGVVAYYYGAGAFRQLPAKPEAMHAVSGKSLQPAQNGQPGYSYTDKSAPCLNGPVDLYTGPQAKRANLEICRRPDGSLWLLGEGACGKVYKAMRDGVQEVAVKVLAASQFSGIAEGIQLQEIHLMHKLSYDRNMVQLYGACLDSTCPMLVMEYMEGGDLQSCILQDCYPNSIGAFRWYKKGGRVALDVAKGLVFLHEQKVVHNDIKSKNILLTKDAAVAKIADVGTSRILETTACSLSAPMLYTWCYAAPEQIKGSRGDCTVKVSLPARQHNIHVLRAGANALTNI